jgi:hypothetical protein
MHKHKNKSVSKETGSNGFKGEFLARKAKKRGITEVIRGSGHGRWPLSLERYP